ncbi:MULTISPECIES: hypothetical protein [Sphingobium]|uniref:Uncharacterized protein n=1 Tax=Sphingobium chungbukense TaxID=56193 RepID=A0A0M3AVX1_9SPHN|nr:MULTISPECIES: hypothetical protein [Sphingobium]KKW93066.1 hypothetical protein YP76_07750 [Sphingobium chungbukense]PJG49931.1 hypothetical protein CAF53_16230 [Sphingobium sp. LB126]
MIDLSPQPRDKGSGTAHPAPRHDAVDRNGKEDRSSLAWWRHSHIWAETAIQRLSRWAGPVALALTLGLLGWWIIH